MILVQFLLLYSGPKRYNKGYMIIDESKGRMIWLFIFWKRHSAA